MRISVPAFAAAASALFANPWAVAQTAFTYPDFTSTAGLTLSGSSASVSGVLRVVPAVGNRGGVVWRAASINTAAGFETVFLLRISTPGGCSDGQQVGADGLAFVIQGVSSTAIGEIGGSIGYGGIARSLAVEFDTFNNGPSGFNNFPDPSTNHVAIMSRGLLTNSVNHSLAQIASVNVPGNFMDGVTREVRIRYENGVISVRVDGTVVLSTPTIDLPAFIGLGPGGSGWVGFTAATGCAWGNHDVLSWSYATLSNAPFCYPNCDGSTAQPVLNALDFSCFLTRFTAGQSLPAAQQTTDYANCDGSTAAPILNALDFSCFLQRYRAGCP